MSTATKGTSAPVQIPSASQRRLPKEHRQKQLVETAWALVRQEGTEALTLGRLAEAAGVTKPVVYNHFGTRSGLLVLLYREFDALQTDRMAQALQTSAPTLEDRAAIIASAYIGCVMAQGREITGIIAALASSPELEAVKRECENVFLTHCRDALGPFAPRIGQAGLLAMLGAAEALSAAAANGELQQEEAQDELYETIVAMVRRHRQRASSE
ncbi:TetR/AcrR family transcriptional regulator [Neorhizobium sp. JUb45]|uniref:TetR/AcrR family transcriptional regulator n=1 Tax=unclassified Neorhizobium TaxID=2629175 RepID=UPI0010531AEF|nr:TetR/AcrR family transcriptional regulator [Neorhizobium sp. JUb45]TCR06539.1 TetR family transcriptional regulator [Neorhizobium sp. JUb45]